MMIAKSPILVLNKSWVPVAVSNLERMMAKVCGYYKSGEPKAKIIDPINDFIAYSWEDWSKLKPYENEQVIRTKSDIFRLPEVVLLTRYDKIPENKVCFNRRAIFNRDQHVCQYCGRKTSGKDATIDHVVPRKRSGLTTWENVVLCCFSCNVRKGCRTPSEAGMKLIREPFKPKTNVFSIGAKEIPKSWGLFLSEIYWMVELENQNKP